MRLTLCVISAAVNPAAQEVHHERQGVRRAPHRHRPAGALPTERRQGACQQALQHGVVRRDARAQDPAVVDQAIAGAQQGQGPVVRRRDPPAPVQLDDAQPGGGEQVGERRAQGAGARQHLPDADELLDMGQQPLDHRDPRRPPALRVDGIVQAPADVGAGQPGELDVQAVLHPVFNSSAVYRSVMCTRRRAGSCRKRGTRSSMGW